MVSRPIRHCLIAAMNDERAPFGGERDGDRGSNAAG